MLRASSSPSVGNSSSVRKLSFFSRLVLTANVLLSVYSLPAYVAMYVPPGRFWPAGFLSLSLPVVMVLHGLFMVYWLTKSPKRALLSLAVLAAGFPLLRRTAAFHPTPTEPQGTTLKVISYNSQLLNAHDYFNKGNKEKPRQAISWLVDSDADILCLQEFYNQDNSSTFNATQRLQKAGYFAYAKMQFGNNTYWGNKGFIGVAIFTKFPILNSGDINFPGHQINRGVFVDVRVGKDTLRIINLHLHSMSIETERLGDRKNLSGLKEDSRYTFKKLRTGFVTRSQQINQVDWYVRNSPHRVILCGDFNDLPYSYTYQRVRRRLNNAFEDAGNGFGFTINDRKLFFLRIDNQFYDERLRVLAFRTHRNVAFADHFPISATYSIPQASE